MIDNVFDFIRTQSGIQRDNNRPKLKASEHNIEKLQVIRKHNADPVPFSHTKGDSYGNLIAEPVKLTIGSRSYP